MPQSAEATVKPAIATMKTRRRPHLLQSQPPSGVAMAAATM